MPTPVATTATSWLLGAKAGLDQLSQPRVSCRLSRWSSCRPVVASNVMSAHRRSHGRGRAHTDGEGNTIRAVVERDRRGIDRLRKRPAELHVGHRMRSERRHGRDPTRTAFPVGDQHGEGIAVGTEVDRLDALANGERQRHAGLLSGHRIDGVEIAVVPTDRADTRRGHEHGLRVLRMRERQRCRRRRRLGEVDQLQDRKTPHEQQRAVGTQTELARIGRTEAQCRDVPEVPGRSADGHDRVPVRVVVLGGHGRTVRRGGAQVRLTGNDRAIGA